MKRMGMREGWSALRKGFALVCVATLGGVASAATLHVDGASGEVGYEWVDRFSASVDDLSTRVDFSSLTLGAGVAFRF